jgi:hypothetical protein
LALKVTPARHHGRQPTLKCERKKPAGGDDYDGKNALLENARLAVLLRQKIIP